MKFSIKKGIYFYSGHLPIPVASIFIFIFLAYIPIGLTVGGPDSPCVVR